MKTVQCKILVLLSALLLIPAPRGSSGTGSPHPSQGKKTGPSPGEDSSGLSLHDGRFIFGKKLSRKKGGLVVHFDNGEVFVPQSMIQSFFSTGEELRYEPKNESERKKLGKGLVPYKNRWISRRQVQRIMKKEAAKKRKEIEEQKKSRRWMNAPVVKDKHFTFKHNLASSKFEELRVLMNNYWDTFLKYWKAKSKLDRSRTAKVHLYADYGDYKQISGAPGGAVGFYNPKTCELHFYWDRTDPEYTIDVMFHEANHLMVDLTNGRFDYPDWLEESMAEYFGASQWHWDPVTKQGKMTLGHLQAGRLTVVQMDIRKDQWLKLEDMIDLPDFAARHYAWGWTFVHFLLSTKKYGKKFRKFYLDLAHGKGIKKVDSWGDKRTISPETGKSLILKRLGVKSLEALQKEWYAYIKALQVQEVGALEQAGRYLKMFGRFKEAKEILGKATAKGAKLAKTYSAYAELLTKGSERELRMRMIDKAIELDPLEPEFYYRKAEFLREDKKSSAQKEAGRLYRLAAEMAPEALKYQIGVEMYGEG